MQRGEQQQCFELSTWAWESEPQNPSIRSYLSSDSSTILNPTRLVTRKSKNSMILILFKLRCSCSYVGMHAGALIITQQLKAYLWTQREKESYRYNNMQWRSQRGSKGGICPPWTPKIPLTLGTNALQMFLCSSTTGMPFLGNSWGQMPIVWLVVL